MTVRNLLTKKVGVVRRRIAEHPVFGVQLEIVPEGSKDEVSLDDAVKASKDKTRAPEKASTPTDKDTK